VYNGQGEGDTKWKGCAWKLALIEFVIYLIFFHLLGWKNKELCTRIRKINSKSVYKVIIVQRTSDIDMYKTCQPIINNLINTINTIAIMEIMALCYSNNKDKQGYIYKFFQFRRVNSYSNYIFSLAIYVKYILG
jgi:hypothetical protein